MARFEDTPDLFGRGVGSKTNDGVTCDVCGRKHRSFPDEDGVGWTTFGPITVAECCFENIESAVLSRMNDIIPWYIRLLKSSRLKLEARERMVAELRKALEA